MRTRLGGRAVTLLRGVDAARFFYEDDRFSRAGALPPTVVHALQDVGSVQTLTGPTHRHRKAAFVAELADGSALALVFARRWEQALAGWHGERGVALLPASGRILTASALEWAGTDPEADLDARTREFLAMIDGAGSFGLRNAAGLLLRRRTERWARGAVRRARAREESTVVGRLARWTDPFGDLLPVDVAAVELLNLLRPTVAVSRFLAFGALALAQHPQWRERVRDDSRARDAFVREVRRTTPFFPAVAGTATRPSSFGGVRFERGDGVILDIFATNRHPELWDDPDVFRPERFLDDGSTPEVVAQGAGPIPGGHRCPGEPATEDLLAVGLKTLAFVPWRLAPQDLRVDLRRMPARPGAHGLRVDFVR